MVSRWLVAMTVVALCSVSTGVLAQEPSARPAPAPVVPGVLELFTGLGDDAAHLSSRDSLLVLGIGGGLAGLSGLHDATLASDEPYDRDASTVGSTLGSTGMHAGAALSAYVLGRATGRPMLAHVGADLVQVQLLSGGVTQGLKHLVGRERPDGASHSFPSGHTSATFATASVLQRHLGWKVGVPAYYVAAYVAGGRIREKQHYLSDVVFGAAIGIAAGYAVTLGHGRSRLAVAPFALPGGGGVMLTPLSR